MSRWKLVPVDPTPEMFAVQAPEIEQPGDFGTMKYRRGIWHAMLAAAPPTLEMNEVLRCAQRLVFVINENGYAYDYYPQYKALRDALVMFRGKALEDLSRINQELGLRDE